ncbi:CpxR [Erythrobacter sp. SG61-1L]|uniref:response regulator transcription factor n=1 Tax=Erythrobacter sp. SG61-1L TaxID=1603897 RepID=UPI0006D6DE7C|nr:response regulator transcription factor [Erythrobacter sp. SG61-1L]KPL66765.1 CpxR [Erythrobacter sp. SG61-1L]
MSTDHPFILLVDDDADLSALLREYLEGEGFEVEIVSNGTDGAARALSGEHDAVILDVMLPGINGIEVLRMIRRSSEIPVLMLTARGDQIDRVVGLELGADDYVAKPHYPRELVARLRAVMRRNTAHGSRPADPVVVGGLEVQVAARRASWNGQPLELTASEFNLLVVLMRTGDDVATKDSLSQEGLGRARQSYDRSVDVHVSNLRIKLEGSSGGAIAIETVRGVGYRLQVTA